MNSSKNRLIIRIGMVFLLFAWWALPSLAQQEKGDKELQLQGLLDAKVLGSGKGIAGNIYINFGYFFTEQSEAGVGTNLSFTSGSFKPGVGLTGFYRYHFRRTKANLHPYAGIDFFAASLTSMPSESLFVRPNFGLKYFVKRNVAFDLNAGYLVSVKHPKEDGQIDARFGVSYIF
jgi:hypothetical protein